jgi:hypothetical protein
MACHHRRPVLVGASRSLQRLLISSETVTIRTTSVLSCTIAADAFMPASIVGSRGQLSRRARAIPSRVTSWVSKSPPCPHGHCWAVKLQNHSAGRNSSASAGNGETSEPPLWSSDLAAPPRCHRRTGANCTNAAFRIAAWNAGTFTQFPFCGNRPAVSVRHIWVRGRSHVDYLPGSPARPVKVGDKWQVQISS